MPYLDRVPLIEKLYEEILQVEADPKSSFKLRHLANRYFHQLNRKSFDCHSFAQHLLGISNSQIPTAPSPHLNRRFNGTTREFVTRWLNTRQGQTYNNQRVAISLDLSSLIPIRVIDINGNFMTKVSSNYASGIGTQNSISRHVLLYNFCKGKKRGRLHSGVLIGESAIQDELWVADKPGIGSNARISTLTDVLETYKPHMIEETRLLLFWSPATSLFNPQEQMENSIQY